MREERTAALRPLVQRMHTGHCWLKTGDGPRRISAVFDEVKLSEHVMGGNAYGLCPIAPGSNTTRVACLDLDSHKGEVSWDRMCAVAQSLCNALEEALYAAHPFRSSGGSGIHIYVVWNEPQDAYSVREMLRTLLEAHGFQSGTKGVAHGEIEIFPKQNAVPADGFGSMFILPFAGKSAPVGDFESWEASAAVPVLAPPSAPERAAIDLPELSRLRAALDAIPNAGTKELDYDAWRNVVFAIHHATDGSDEGLALALDFSSRSSKHDDAFLRERVWPYIRSERGGAVITERSIFATAAQNGWLDPAIADAFDVFEETDGSGPGVSNELGQAKVKRDRFTPIQAAEFAKGSPPSWFIKDVLPRADLGVFYGESGSGKSFLVLDMAAALAQGLEWRGHRTAKARVIYIAAEGATGFKKRLKAYAEHHGIPLDELDIYVVPDAPNFMKADDITALIEAVRAYGKPDIIVVDTLAQVMPGANENAGEDVGKALGHCKTLRQVTGGMVILVHHSGKDASKGARGWSGLKAACDFEFEIIRIEHDRVATITKLKDGEDGAEFGFKLQIVPVGMDEDGDVISSCVVQHTAAIPKSKRKQREKGDVEKIVWQSAIDLQGLDGRHPTYNEVIEHAVNNMVPPDDGKTDTRRDRAVRAIKALVARGDLVSRDGRISLPEAE